MVAAVLIVAFLVGVFLGLRIDRAAARGERVYQARHRDHGKVPQICWRSA